MIARRLALCLLCLVAQTAPAAEPTGMARKLIEHFKMTRIPDEGCWFALSYQSADPLPPGSLPARYAPAARVAGSAIYALETPADFSALHRLQTDEIWHYYGGAPLELLLLYPDGHGETVTLGPDVLAGQQPQFVVPRGVWQGSRPVGDDPEAYTLFGDTLAPGFDYSDFEPGYRDELQKAYPKFAQPIARLTRPEFATRPAAKPAAPAAEASVFQQDEAPAVEAGPGLALRELLGRAAKAQNLNCSIAYFQLAPGKSTGTSYCRISAEVFLVLAGSGTVHLGERSEPVRAGSVVVIPPGQRHSLVAGDGARLDFYAVSSPAFSPADYVRE